jgi:hypothetical protein
MTDANEIVAFLYFFLRKRMTPEALDAFIKKGLQARGSRSVHGFMNMLSDLHEEAKLQQIRVQQSKNLNNP